VREPDVAVGVGHVGTELEDHFIVLQRILKLLVPDGDLNKEFIGSDVFGSRRMEAMKPSGESLHPPLKKQDPQTSIIDSSVSSPLPSPSGRPPVGKGGGRWAYIDEGIQPRIGCHS
jgi:hypothetical protein